MAALDIVELEKVAQAYERLLTPALFAEWAPRLAGAAEVREGHHVLDVASGTGTLAQVLAERVGPTGKVSGVDSNPGMLAVAKRLAPGVEWREGDAQALPFEDHSFDAVLCQFGLMFFPAPKAALLEMRRVLRPQGKVVVAVFCSLSALPAYAIMAQVYERLVAPSVGEALRMPFSMGNKDELASLFASAGLPSADIKTHEGVARFSSVKHMVLADVEGWFPFAGIELDDKTIDAVSREAETALEAFMSPSGGVTFTVPAHIITATE